MIGEHAKYYGAVTPVAEGWETLVSVMFPSAFCSSHQNASLQSSKNHSLRKYLHSEVLRLCDMHSLGPISCPYANAFNSS